MIRERYPGIEFEKGWRDDIFDSLTPEQRNILVLDDQMGVTSSSKSLSDVFTKRSHQRNLTVIYLVKTCKIKVRAKGPSHLILTTV